MQCPCEFLPVFQFTDRPTLMFPLNHGASLLLVDDESQGPARIGVCLSQCSVNHRRISHRPCKFKQTRMVSSSAFTTQKSHLREIGGEMGRGRS